jgi:hypothetical protein
MSEYRSKSRHVAGTWAAPRFWDEVEHEVESLDLWDLVDFIAADRLPIEPRPGFEAELREDLRAYVRRRYSH